MDERFLVFGPRAIEIGLRAVFTFPLRHGNHCLGALDLYRNTPGALNPGAIASAQILADVTAAYLVNAQARAHLQASFELSHDRSVHDALTGLPNRLLLFERVEHAIIRSDRSQKLVALLFIDLDHFKEVNDAYGHQVGDELLVSVAERIGGAIRPADTLARISGDEFVILCEDLEEVEQVEIVASRIVDALGTPFVLADDTIEISGSIGIAFAGQDLPDPEHLLHAADLAMYQVKRHGGSGHQIVDLRSSIDALCGQQLLAKESIGQSRDIT
jgi:diguanylate cyclase (GGDEF)-like protein